jgi:predicted transcriptional regulator
MTKGYIITNWTEDQGLGVQLSYPEDLIVDLDDMMRIFYAHITGAGEAGNVLVRLEKARSNVSSYFTGMESENQFMINFIMELGEDPEIFGEAVLSEINQNIIFYLKNIKQNPANSLDITSELANYLKNSLTYLERLKNLTKEQVMAQIYNSEKGRLILEILQEKPYTKKDLHNLLEEKTGKFIPNLDILLSHFVKTDLVRQDWIEGDSDITLFLLSDFIIVRRPVSKLINDAKKGVPNPYVANKYIEIVTSYFSNYTPTEEDNLKIARHMINPDVFDYVVLFREKSYPINKVPRGPGETFDQVRTFLATLEADNVIKIIKDESNVEWIFLITDLTAQKFYPEYLIENIRKAVSEDILKKESAIKHLELLEQIYKK